MVGLLGSHLKSGTIWASRSAWNARMNSDTALPLPTGWWQGRCGTERDGRLRDQLAWADSARTWPSGPVGERRRLRSVAGAAGNGESPGTVQGKTVLLSHESL
jgi:hypothetical protein